MKLIFVVLYSIRWFQHETSFFISAYEQGNNFSSNRSTSSSPATFSCPDASYNSTTSLEEGEYVIIHIPFNETIKLTPSLPGQLCTLRQIKKNGDFIPVGRSYNEHKWEAAPGLYSTLSFDCVKTECSVVVTVPSSDEYQQDTEDVQFQLSSYSHSLSPRNEIARFLEQATFGTTLEDLDAMQESLSDVGMDMQSLFSNWVHHQIYSVPPTSHRELFRTNTVPHLQYPDVAGRVTHPCEAGSRWRRSSLSSKDKGKDLIAIPILRDDHQKYVLSIDGQVRTLVETLELDIDDHEYHLEPGVAYKICSSSSLTGDKVSLLFDGKCTKLKSGNPPVYLDRIEPTPTILNIGNSSITKHLVLAQENDGDGISDEIIVSKLDDVMCRLIPPIVPPLKGRTNEPIFATLSNGQYMIHDPHLVWEDNTVNDPLHDGGASIVTTTAAGTYCSNVPRTFLNEKSCKLSTAENVCVSHDTIGSLMLNSTVIRQIFEATGRAVYVVSNLRLTDDSRVQSPCQYRFKSRWKRLKTTNCKVNVSNETALVFSSLIREKALRENAWITDLYIPEGHQCHKSDTNKKRMIIEVDDRCWKTVHPDLYNVYDFTDWSKDHPGMADPIFAFGKAGKYSLVFPDHHPMQRWRDSKIYLDYIGSLDMRVSIRDLPDVFKTKFLTGLYDVMTTSFGGSGLVCGSPGEVSNGNEYEGYTFDITRSGEEDTTTFPDFKQQKKTLWTTAAIYSPDQLRQRTAWALAQLFVLSEFKGHNTEIHLSFYDIFVRNAFGLYKDAFREVVYSPLMSEMLSYYKSKSSEYMWKSRNEILFADENAAREFMQLFSIGQVELNIDGTEVLDSNGKQIRTYSNDDIMEYARVWTGFDVQSPRGNVEERSDYLNSLDPMKIQAEWRDVFPKMGLNGVHVGEGYGLCTDLPLQSFLKKGAKFRLLGRNSLPTLQPLPLHNHPDKISFLNIKTLQLDEGSELLDTLCSPNGVGDCSYPATVSLGSDMSCFKSECDVDSVKVVQVQDNVFYEYVERPCVHFTFFGTGKSVSTKQIDGVGMKMQTKCVDPQTLVASVDCTNHMKPSLPSCFYTGELTPFNKAKRRCKERGERIRKASDLSSADCDYCSRYAGLFWQKTSCQQHIIIGKGGKIAIERENSSDHLSSLTFFRVHWENMTFPSVEVNECGQGSCESIGQYCRCGIAIQNSNVFTSIPSLEDVLLKLNVGAFSISLDKYVRREPVDGVITYVKKRHGQIDHDTIFEVVDGFGRTVRRRNVYSLVHIQGVMKYNFRNPPRFHNGAFETVRDAQYEVEAALDHLVYHQNTAPFIAMRFIQRFGVSNPSPRFIKSVALAFSRGTFTFTTDHSSQRFGSGKYGDMAAMIASILLDRESRDVILDADSIQGGLREPLLKVLSIMRNLGYVNTEKARKFVGLYDLDIRIGQMVHSLPSVFGFFSHDYSPTGKVSSAGLFAPEAILLHYAVTLLNGLFSLVKFGLGSCYGGFGGGKCTTVDEGMYNSSLGYLSFPKMGDNVDDIVIVNELVTLLTSGRMSAQSREIIKEAYSKEKDKAKGLRVAEQIVLGSPEFHSTGLSRKNGLTPVDAEPIRKSCKGYKAVIHLLLKGGLDSYNVLSPLGIEESSGKDLYEEYKIERGSVALEKDVLLPIDASNQPCSQFGLHPSLPLLQSLYSNQEECLFVANVGVLNKPVTAENYDSETTTQLFAHNSMQNEIGLLGGKTTGLLGRLSDSLSKHGYKVNSFAIDSPLIGVEGALQNSTKVAINSLNGFIQFNPRASEGVESSILALNNGTRSDSNIYSDTWSSSLHQTLQKNDEFYYAQEGVVLDEKFDRKDLVSNQLEFVSRMILSHECRGSDRDLFYIELPHYDHHAMLKESLEKELNRLNRGLESFINEMRRKNHWDNIAMVVTSDFGRTLSPNSGDGTDHGWGGHSFILGGSVKGGKILGTYPNDLSEDGPLNLGRGRILPTLSWEAIWNGVTKWTGIREDHDLNYVLPNRELFLADLYHDTDLFKDNTDSDTDDGLCSADGSLISCKP